MPPARRRHLILVAIVATALLVSYPLLRDAWRGAGRGAPPSAGIPMPSLEPAAAWLGGPVAPEPGTPLAIVVFSTTDPRALELLADAEAWHDAYARRGVRVIGLHRPELAFAADTAGLTRALARLRVRFPVAHDPGLAVRLPAVLPQACALVGDAGGSAFLATNGEERAAADLWLRARAQHRRPPLPAMPATQRAEPRRLVRLGAGDVTEGPLAGVATGEAVTFITQTRGEEEGRAWVPVPVGRWIPRGEGLEAARAGAADFLAIRYHARRVGVVASPPPGGAARLWILRDEGWVPGDRRGRDLAADAAGATYLEFDEPRLLVAVERDSGWHVLRISPATPGLRLHRLTFDGPPTSGGR